MDFIKVQWFCCNFILQLHFLFYHKPLDFVGDLCYIFSDVFLYIYIYIYIYKHIFFNKKLRSSLSTESFLIFLLFCVVMETIAYCISNVIRYYIFVVIR